MLIRRKKTDIAKRLGITRQTLTNKLKTPNLSLDFILRASNILGYSFLREIPELHELYELRISDQKSKYSSTVKAENWKKVKSQARELNVAKPDGVISLEKLC